MLKKLSRHWKVNGADLFFILLTFAVTGTFTAWVSKEITTWLLVEKYSAIWWFLKLLVLLIGYQVFIIFFGFCFGQFSFFWKYEKKILRRMGLIKKEVPVSIAVFASGTGTNAANIISYFKNHTYIHVGLVVCNNPIAGVIQIAIDAGTEVMIITRENFQDAEAFIAELRKRDISWIILAGFLWKIPPAVIRAFPEKILNIHPALLPKYGGHGMYGRKVHETVLEEGELESGISIHYVDDVYDNGTVIHQSVCRINKDDNPDSLARKIHALEHQHYPVVIEKVIQKQRAR